MEKTVTIVIPGRKCPSCSTDLSATTGGSIPKKGDLTICMYCQSILIFNADFSHHKATEEELQALKEKEPDFYNMVWKAVYEIKERQFSKK